MMLHHKPATPVSCPFCGEDGQLVTVSIPFGADCADIYVRCVGCSINGPMVLVDIDHDTNDDIPRLEVEAIDAWNRRVNGEERLSVALDAALQRAAKAESRLYDFRRHRTANSMALADFIKARAPEIWPDYAALGVNYSYFDEATDRWVNPNYHGEMHRLEHRAEKAEEDATVLRISQVQAAATVAELRAALEPFVTWAADEVDAEGWKTPPMRERIVDWFGPTDFRRAQTAFANSKPTNDRLGSIKVY